MKLSVQDKKILEEVKQAYIDAWSDKCFDEVEPLRNLDFRASEPVSPKVAVQIMKKAVPNGYNDFTPDLLDVLDDCQVTLAREGSVCIYVDRELTRDERKALSPDEYNDYAEKGWRLWWD